jgi:DNA topoisomerase-1
VSPIRTYAGPCTATFTDRDGEGDRERRQRGRALVVVKPDDTVLVHDARGYQPAAWLTRPESLSVTREDVHAGPGPADASDAVRIDARDGGQRLRVRVEEPTLDAAVPASPMGVPVAGRGPDGGDLIRARGAVVAPGSGERYPLPAGATVLERTCDCGLPLARVERGASVEVCVDRDCDPLDDAVREALDREFDCPDCGADLRVRRRGSLLLGCDGHPDCETGFAIPEGVIDGTCGCGLPAFSAGDGRRCLDATCGRT